MTDYRNAPSTDPQKPDFIVGDDTVDFDQMVSILRALEAGIDASEAGETSDLLRQAVEKIKADKEQLDGSES